MGALNIFFRSVPLEIRSIFSANKQLTILLRVRLSDRLIDACADLGFLLPHGLFGVTDEERSADGSK
ncbi:MAG: hypothetical protein ACJ8EL_20280, partial [Rhizomicrobium sp.]